MDSAEAVAGRELQNQLAEVSRQRIAALEDATRLHAAMQALLQHEARRIEHKFGAQHPRTQGLNARVRANVALLLGLEIERQLLQINVPVVDERSALVHGRVVDQDNLGIERLIVSLVEASGAPIRDITEAVTNASGYFAFVLDPETIDRLGADARGGVFAAVFTSRRRLLAQHPKPLVLGHGARLTVKIALDRADLSPPPSPAPSLVAVPELVGRKESEALAALREVGLKLGSRDAVIAPDRVDRVLEQSPQPGTQLAPGASVSLVIGIAEAVLVRVPSLVRLALKNAKKAIERAELELGTVTGPSPTDESRVKEQEPAADTEVPRGTAINVVVR